MRKFLLLGLVLGAVCAFGILSVAGASALTFLLAEWLESGKGITATLLAEIPDELAFTETLDGIKIDVLCSAILDGFVGPDGAAEITETLNLGGEAISLIGLTGTAIACTNSENCGEPLAWGLDLPWLSLYVLMEDGIQTFFDDLTVSQTTGEEVAYEIECMSLGLADTCSVSEVASKVENVTEGVNIEFSDAFTELAGLKLFSCEIAGTEAGVVEGLGLISVTGVTLTLSE
jgi:hypothetical protein